MKQLEFLLAEKLLKASAIKLQPDNPFMEYGEKTENHGK